MHEKPITTDKTTHYMNAHQFPGGFKETEFMSDVDPKPGEGTRYRVVYEFRVTVETAAGETHEYHEWNYFPTSGADADLRSGRPRYAIDALGVLHIIYRSPNPHDRDHIVRSYSPTAWLTVSQPQWPAYDLSNLPKLGD